MSLSHPWDGYDAAPNVGSVYQLAIWGVKATAPKDPSQVRVSFQNQDGNPVNGGGLSGRYDVDRAVVIANIPVDLVPSLAGPEVLESKTGQSIVLLVEGLN